jgi:hypothetical protein
VLREPVLIRINNHQAGTVPQPGSADRKCQTRRALSFYGFEASRTSPRFIASTPATSCFCAALAIDRRNPSLAEGCGYCAAEVEYRGESCLCFTLGLAL